MAVDVAVARDDAHHLASARADGELTAVGAERAGRGRAAQFPRARLMSVRRVEKRARRADLYAVAALRAVEPAAVGSDDRVRAPAPGLDGVLAHPLVADTRAALTENAALRIVGDHWREILLGRVVLLLGEALFEVAPVEDHLLQLALAAAVADGAVQRVIREKKLDHPALRLLYLLRLRSDDHPVRAVDRAGGLKLRHLLDAHEAHAARSLKREVGVVAETGNRVPVLAAHVNETRALLGLQLLPVNRYLD